ncbi:D site-binding protein [Mycobacterium intracellulare]|uniref:D site-binding protein n=1 Tax=Mycobacterium intracellulare TaxID=1767 RepID=A0AAE4RA39_MYCIT|nr:D site-binding protein [Mycobacterium intracellulare]MDV6975340.1 D site-binding protein [Mycobacterium intracellulare]MDV6980404.1 D site-binding protein [Mycobacterium intracellulare]MDV7010833.1 D site-binding protein [Mycobacterium intracellulare]MDV7025739.1 D site-binding protein [Mycobacterium intracellulare]
MIDKFGEVLIPDLKHEYGIDLRDLFSEDRPISPRWVLMHARTLPMGSAFVAEIRGGREFRGWDQGRYMQATLIDAVRLLQYIFILAHVDPKKSKPKPPESFPLPDKNIRTKKPDKPGSFGFIAKDLIRKSRQMEGGG